MTLRADHPYTVTDLGSGVTADSLRAWQQHRASFSTFVRADVSMISGQAGPAYADSGAGPVHPTLVLTDDAGRTLALNGTPCGFRGEGPRGTARILADEGLLPVDEALDVVSVMEAETLRRPAQVIDLRQPEPVRDSSDGGR